MPDRMMPSQATPRHFGAAAALLLAICCACDTVHGQTGDPIIQPNNGTAGDPGQGISGSTRHRAPPLKPSPKPTGDPRLAGLDDATRMVVELELRGASPAEREQWLTMISSVDPSQVGYLLEARRRSAATTPTGSATPATVPVQPSGRPPAVNHRVVGHAVRPASHSAEVHNPVDEGRTAFSSPTEPVAAVAPPETPAHRDAPIAAPAEEEVVPAYRRLLNPLRGRWGEGRQEAAGEPSAATVPAVPPPVTPQRATEARSSAYMNVELQRVMSLLRSELVDAEKSGLSPADPAYRRMHLQMKLLHLLADEPEQVLQAIPNLPADQQQFWIQLLWALTNELDVQADRPDVERTQRTAELLDRAQRELRQSAPLRITTACFCHRIHSFGNYDRFGQDEFRPGQPVLIYAEVGNFQSELTPENVYRTRMHSSVEVFPADPQGQIVVGARAIERRDFPAADDLCRSPRQDYFHSHRIDLPPQLPQGRYVLRLTLTDDLGQKSAVVPLPFMIR